MRRFLSLFVLVLVLGLAPWSGLARAQTQDAINYEEWARTAVRAEAAIEAGRASDVAMQGLRSELAIWRQQFAGAQSQNAKTIAAVRAQLDALGPAPENGTEDEDIANQRKALSERLARLSTPGRTAEVALSRVNVLVSEIDVILRERQTEALMARGPTPLNPAVWGRGWSALGQSLLNTRNEVAAAWNNPIQNSTFRKNLPVVLVLAVIGIVLLARGRRWMLRLYQRVMARRVTPARWLAAFVLSLGQVVLPLMGLTSLIWALYMSQLVGLRMDPLLNEVGNAGLMILIAMWLGGRIFPKHVAQGVRMNLPPDKMREGRLVTGLVGLVLGLNGLMKELARFDAWSDEVRAVMFFPLIALGGVLIWRVGVLLRMQNRQAAEDAREPGEPIRYSERLFQFLGRALAVLAFVPPLLAAVGYLRAAQRTMFPLMESLLLLAFVLILQRVLAELYVLIRRREEVRDGLIPVLTGLVLILLATPQFALIWGVSRTQLHEMWRAAREGFQIGDTTISLNDFLTLVVVFVIGLTITRLLQGTLKNTVLPKTRMDMGAQNAFVSGLGYVGIFLAALIAITSAGIDLSSLAIVAGALSVGIGFGLQNIVSNFVSGIILLIERPISEGDWIEVGGQMGYVRDISVRSTRIETFDRTDVIVPNADFVSGTVTNYTRGNTIGRVIVSVGVAYGTDTKKVEAILLEIAQAHPLVLLDPPPRIVFQNFGASSLDFEIRAILRDVNWVLSVKSDMNHEIARRFAEEGIEIPFAQTDIWLRNPEVLQGGAKAETGPQEPEEGAQGERLVQLDDSDFEDPDGDGDGGDR